MTLEQQVCSLDLAKRLKELGVKQRSHFYHEDAMIIQSSPLEINYAAFTVAELGEMLREEEFELPTYLSSTKEWVAVCETTLIGGADTEADARAKMLIYLLENNLTPASQDKE